MRIFDTIKKWLIAERYLYWIRKDKEKMAFIKHLSIMSAEDTIDYIIKNHCNVSRFGDGEFYVASGASNGFQKQDKRLSMMLRDVLATSREDLLLCIPIAFTTLRGLTLNSKLFITEFIHNHLKVAVMPYVTIDKLYGDSLFTRFYMSKSDKNHKRMLAYVNKLKSIWANQDVLLVEGEFSRNGVGNDLFDNTKSLERILCPAKDAFDRYDDILSSIRLHGKGKLVLMALGMTATVLAKDLLNDGIWAIDLGHIDTEYEWFRMKVKKKVAIPNKIVDEVVKKGDYQYIPEDRESQKYKNQIIDIII